ncbi:MAG: nucleoside triphosphate pyrophosphohydrolase [Candidatus Pacearchaeota archaeon]|jgi:predicted house-cleaning noncanonical NTP pyrophosphatase (MazG superfamily)
MEFNKLVRDKIPNNWNSKYGKNPKTHIANDEEFYDKLKDKLLEETREFLKEDNSDELADILEIVYTIAKFKNLNLNELEALRKSKEQKSGAFKKRIILENSED